jgi:TRAP-type C4-dicarboxylate transport system substrate-binding protein
MIDEKTAAKWAVDAGFKIHRHGTQEMIVTMSTGGVWVQCDLKIQAIITRAMHEAYERAANIVQANNTAMTDMIATEIRALKQETPK